MSVSDHFFDKRTVGKEFAVRKHEVFEVVDRGPDGIFRVRRLDGKTGLLANYKLRPFRDRDDYRSNLLDWQADLEKLESTWVGLIRISRNLLTSGKISQAEFDTLTANQLEVTLVRKRGLRCLDVARQLVR